MKPLVLALSVTSLAAPAFAQDTREMDAHVHGVSTAQIAVEDGTLEIDLVSPGMDIVGFEYEATSAQDKDAVAAAIGRLTAAGDIVTLPDAAGCRLTGASAELETGEDEHDHDHDDEHDEDHDDDHDHEDEDAHDHEDDDHAGEDAHDHEDEEHADEEAHGAHTEFHASYAFACDDPSAVTTIDFPFFTQFENAAEIEAQYVTESGAGTAELTPDAAELTFE